MCSRQKSQGDEKYPRSSCWRCCKGITVAREPKTPMAQWLNRCYDARKFRNRASARPRSGLATRQPSKRSSRETPLLSCRQPCLALLAVPGLIPAKENHFHLHMPRIQKQVAEQSSLASTSGKRLAVGNCKHEGFSGPVTARTALVRPC